MTKHLPPPDHEVRERFAGEHERNFALISPAGSGKTHGIVDRITRMGRRPDADRLLPRLAVCTFTKRSAEEMKQRARESFRRAKLTPAVQAALDEAFFGTIHSFAVELLRRHGHLIGVPAAFEVAPDDAGALWVHFLRESGTQADIYENPVFRRALRHIPLQVIHQLVQTWDSSRTVPNVGEVVPEVDFSPIYSYVPKVKRADTLENIALFQRRVRAFEKAFTQDGADFVELPAPEKGGQAFIDLCQETLAPVGDWLKRVAVAIAGSTVAAYREYRISRGLLTYDDQIDLAVQLMRHPEAARAVRAEGYIVLLDEAQDTDPGQFDILIEASRPADATGGWWQEGATPPEPGRFTMVGDFQQSIYGSRADLATYRRAHEFIARSAGGEALVFDVTFRCDRAIVDFSNTVFPAILNNRDKQVAYVPLAPRPDAGSGQVVRLPLSAKDGLDGDGDREQEEAEQIAAFLADRGPAGLNAANWGGVAILCPRTGWFHAVREALLRRGIHSVYLSHSDHNYDSPAYLWVTALATIMNEPRNGFEVVGVLRELCGISDRELGFFAKGDGSRFQIETPTEGAGRVAQALSMLTAVRAEVVGRPLRDAIGYLDREVLRPRLRALNSSEFPGLDAEMDKLMALSSSMESDGATLRDYARVLRDNLEGRPDLARERSDAVTILTNLKSKGLQWDAVVVPFLYRKISLRAQPYPRLVGPRHTEACAVFTSEDAAAYESAITLERQQELERLLYVSLTRAKRTLVLVDDRALFAGDMPPAYSLAGALRVNAENAAAWAALPTVLTGPRGLPQKPGLHLGDAVAIDRGALKRHANDFPLKVTPHSQAHRFSAEEPEVRRDQPLLTRDASVSIAYGVWWHETMQTMPWSRPADWEKHFAAELAYCPDRARGYSEWELFAASRLAEVLREHGAKAASEVPFSVALADGRILEGVIDLVVTTAPGRWLIVDWKTGDAESSAEEIFQSYEPQLHAYKQALELTTGEKAEIGVYPTHTGTLTTGRAA